MLRINISIENIFYEGQKQALVAQYLSGTHKTRGAISRTPKQATMVESDLFSMPKDGHSLDISKYITQY